MDTYVEVVTKTHDGYITIKARKCSQMLHGEGNQQTSDWLNSCYANNLTQNSVTGCFIMQLNIQAYIWLSSVPVCHRWYHNLKSCFNFLSVTTYERTQYKTLSSVLNVIVNEHEWKINTHFQYHIWCSSQIWYIFMEHSIMHGT